METETQHNTGDGWRVAHFALGASIVLAYLFLFALACRVIFDAIRYGVTR